MRHRTYKLEIGPPRYGRRWRWATVRLAEIKPSSRRPRSYCAVLALCSPNTWAVMRTICGAASRLRSAASVDAGAVRAASFNLRRVAPVRAAPGRRATAVGVA